VILFLIVTGLDWRPDFLLTKQYTQVVLQIQYMLYNF
jgi:hypothetical protein